MPLGMWTIISMIKVQKPGRYTELRRFAADLMIPAAIFSGAENSGPFLIDAVIGVSTNPGLTVMT